MPPPLDVFDPQALTLPTKRQLECLAWSLYLGQKEAALRIGITEQTLKNHLSALYRKLDAPGAFGAAVILGWVDIPDDVWYGDPVPGKRLKKAVMVRSCEHCGQVFFPRRVSVESGKGRFCSVSCSRTGVKPSHGGKVTYRCAYCRKEFTVKGSRARAGQKYCSRRCGGKGRRQGPTSLLGRGPGVR